MANTTNLDLVKPLGTDHALIAQINGNMDKIDLFAGNTNSSLNSLADGLAIISVGDTHAAITSGQLVYVKGHNTLSEGLYVATANIAANGTLSASNLTADSSGGLNALSGKIAPFDNYTGDLDNAPEGVIYTSTGVTHTPANYAYWYVHTMKKTTDGTIGAQIAIARTGTNPPMYYRVKSGGTWTSWEELALNSKFSEEKVTITTGYDTSEIDEVAYVKCGTTVTVRVTVKAGVAQDWKIVLETGIPTKIRPKDVVYGTHRINTANDLDLRMFSMLNENGTIQFIPNKIPVASVPICFTYPVPL